MSANEKKVIEQPYYSSQTTYAPRYYQRNAINRTVEAIAKGQDRILLVMATGTGKTYTAFQIVYRLLKSGLKKKVLYLADRNILVDQSIQQDFSPLEKTIHKINFAKDDPVTVTSHEVYFSLYQQLAGNEIEDRIYTNSDFDYNIILEDRTYEVAKEITEYLKSTDRMQKTIVFCTTEDHAERMRIALNNLNADMVKKIPITSFALPALTPTARASWIILFPLPRPIR